MTDTSVVFNVIGRESGVGSVLGRVKSLFKSTGAEGAASMKIVDHEVEKLDHDIRSAKDSLQVLAREFAKAATGAERLAISRQMKRESTNLGQLTKARDLLPKDDEVKQESAKVGAIMSSSMGQAIASNPYLTAGILAAGTMAAPLIGGVVAGAVVGAAGSGGIIGGVTIAAHDARVQTAWKGFAAGAKGQMEQAAAPFVPAVIEAIDIAQGEFGRLTPTIRGIFANTAQYLAPLTRGIAGLISEAAPGFAKAAAAAGPIFTMLEHKLPEIGHEISNMFAMLSDNAQGGAQALGTVINILDIGIRGVTITVNALAEAWDFLDRSGALSLLKLMGIVDKLPPKTDAAKSSTLGFNAATKDTAAAADAAAAKVKGLMQTMDDFADTNISVYDAETKAKEAINSATVALEKNGRTHSANTAKGRANRDQIVSLANAFNTVTTANDKANTSGTVTTATYNRQRDSFVKAALAAHYTSAEANNLADRMLKIPKNKIINIQSNAAAARGGINAVYAALARIPREVRIAMRVTGSQSVSASAAALRKQNARAGGGPVQRDQPYLVGEEGPELVVPQTDGTVLTASMTRGVLGGVQPGGRAVGLPAPARSSSGSRAMELRVVGPREVAALVRYLVRTVNVVDTSIGAT